MKRNLAFETRAPLYREVERDIVERLARGEWKPGDKLPTEPELADRFGVAVFTVRAGIQKLVESGILLRRQGKGTFVALHRARPLRNQFLRIYSNDGRKANWDRHFISLEKKRASDDVAKALELGQNARERAIYEVMFLLKNGEKAVAFVESNMNVRLFPHLTASVLSDTADNLYAVFQERFDVNVIRIDERVRAVRAGRAGAKWLEFDADDPVLRIERIAYTYNDKPVEIRYYTVKADDYCYFVPAEA
jgi:GntR family transcriptional regulator